MPATKRYRGHPHKVLHLTSYDRLEEYLRAFAQGHFNLLILVGSGGLAKSRSVRAVLNGKACWIEGNATPFGMYVKLYRHRDQFIVIDDVDALYADRSARRSETPTPPSRTNSRPFGLSAGSCFSRSSKPSVMC